MIGLGKTGRAVARCLSAMGVCVIGVRANPTASETVDRVYGFPDLHQALGAADFVVLCLPLTASTRHCIDEGAIAAVGRLFKEQVPENSVVLDLMSSWRSHWPEGHPKKRMVGLGLNQIEMQENPDLDECVVHNVNINPVLPFDDLV